MMSNRTSVVLTAVIGLLGINGTTRAVDVVYQPAYGLSSFGGTLEAQGFNGRINLPTDIQGFSSNAAPGGYQLAGSAANDTTLFRLVNPTFGSGNSILMVNDTTTGAYESSIQLAGQMSDIAYTNGQLYFIANSGTQLQIDTLNNYGLLEPVLTQSSALGNWKLSGVVGGDSLLAVSAGANGASPGYVINPSTLQVSSINIPSTSPNSLQATIINAAGTAFTAISSNYSTPQPTASYPGGVLLGNRAPGTAYGQDAAPSDEFTMSFAPSQPALAQVSSSAAEFNADATDGLIRNPALINISTTISLTNGLAPDGTSLSNVQATDLQPHFSGPTMPTYSQTLSAPGAFAQGTPLGQFNASLNLNTAQRGRYSIYIAPTITADYAYDSTSDTGRSVQSSSVTLADFAYDPPSANLVGNGDGSLGNYGWESKVLTNVWSRASYFEHGFEVIAFSGNSGALRQILQMLTSNSPMVLRFSDDDLFADGASASINVYLNGILLGTTAEDSTTPVSYQFLIENPALENLNNAELMFTVTTPSQLTTVEIGNISLMAVPEPAMMGIALLGVAAMRRRRSDAKY